MFSSETVINVIESDHRYIREKHIDVLGVVHLLTFTNVGIDDDVASLLIQHATDKDNQLANAEYYQYMADITAGKNPFRDDNNLEIEPNFSGRNSMLSKVLNTVCSTEDATLFMSGVPFLDNLTDADLIALLPTTQAVVDDIRIKAVSIGDTNTFLSNYIPPLGAA